MLELRRWASKRTTYLIATTGIRDAGILSALFIVEYNLDYTGDLQDRPGSFDSGPREVQPHYQKSTLDVSVKGKAARASTLWYTIVYLFGIDNQVTGRRT